MWQGGASLLHHLIFNSTSLDCQQKFRDFLGSGKAVAKLSDLICLEHGLSIVEQPKRGGNSYKSWLGDRAKPSQRDILRAAIDAALAQRPKDLEAFFVLMKDAGFTAGRGAHISFRPDGQKRSIHLRSLGEGYSEAEIRAVLDGEKTHAPKKRFTAQKTSERNQLLIDIKAKLRDGKGVGYERWATVFNLKQMARTVNYLKEHDLLNEQRLAARTDEVVDRFHALSDQIKSAEKRMGEIAVLKKHIINYVRTKDVYAGYRQSGYSSKYLAQHEEEIALHKAAKLAFDELGVAKLPTVKGLQAKYAKLMERKKAAYAEYRSVRSEMKELVVHRENLKRILGKEKTKDDQVVKR